LQLRLDFAHPLDPRELSSKNGVGEPPQGAAFSAPVYRLFDAVCDLELPVLRRTYAAAAGAILAALKKDGRA